MTSTPRPARGAQVLEKERLMTRKLRFMKDAVQRRHTRQEPQQQRYPMPTSPGSTIELSS